MMSSCVRTSEQLSTVPPFIIYPSLHADQVFDRSCTKKWTFEARRDSISRREKERSSRSCRDISPIQFLISAIDPKILHIPAIHVEDPEEEFTGTQNRDSKAFIFKIILKRLIFLIHIKKI